jgi:hypothetical protein
MIYMWNLLRTLAAAIAGLAPFCAVPVLAQEDTIEWLDDYQKALQEARRTHKPIFLEFRCEA